MSSQPDKWKHTLQEIQRENDNGNLGMSVDQIHVEAVRRVRVYFVSTRLPTNVRNAFSDAVKAGTLSHLKADKQRGLEEVYYHPAWEHLAHGGRVERKDEHVRQQNAALLKTMAPPPEFEQ